MKIPPHSQTPLNPADLEDSAARHLRETFDSLVGYGSLPSYLAENADAKTEWAAARKTAAEQIKLPTLMNTVGQIAGGAFWLSLVWLLVTLSYDFTAQAGYWHCVYPVLFIVSGFIGMRRVNKIAEKRKSHCAVMPETFLLLLPFLDKRNRLNAVYYHAVGSLVNQQTEWGAGAAQNLFLDLKMLLQSGKQAGQQRGELENAMSHQTVDDGQAEANLLASRAEAAKDFMARETFKQSLAFLEARLAQMRTMEPLRERLEAQEEAVFQALREAQITLSNPPFAGDWAGTNASGANAAQPLTSWGETAHQLRQQTAAVERAVQEVMVSVGGRAT